MLLALIFVHFPSDLLLIKNQPRLLMTATNAPVVFLSFLFPPFFSCLLPALLLFTFINVYWCLHIVWAHTAIACMWYLEDDLWELLLFPLLCFWECNPWAATALTHWAILPAPSGSFHHVSLQEQILRSWLRSTSCESPSSPFSRTSPPHPCPISGQDK